MPRQQQFTFIDVRAQKYANQRRIKSHVSHDTNRKKRQAAVVKYQNSLILELNEARTPTTNSVVSSIQSQTSPTSVQIRVQQRTESPESKPDLTKADELCKHDEVGLSAQNGQNGQDTWSFYISLLRNGIASPWQAPRKRIISPGMIGSELFTLKGPNTIPLNMQPRSSYSLLPMHIQPPTFMGETERALISVKSFMKSQYHRAWKHEIAANPYVYEHDYECGIFRECLYVAFEELRQRRASKAFAILNNALEAAPGLIKKEQPILIFTLLDIAMDIRNFQDARLNKMLKDYLAGLAATLLGSQHPLVALLQCSTSPEQKNYLLSTLFQSLLDTDSELFGPNNFQTMGVRFAILEHKVAEGTPESLRQASEHFKIVSDEWHRCYPTDSLLCDIIDIEGIRLSQKQGNAAEKDVAIALEKVLQKYENLTVLSESRETKPVDDSTHDKWLMLQLNVLARHWLAKSHHAMTLFSYTHLGDISKSPAAYQPTQQSEHRSARDHFAAKTVRLLLHGSDEES